MELSEKYKSDLKENNVDFFYDMKNLEIGKQLYTNGSYKESMSYIEKIMQKYKEYNTYDSFFIDLLFSYSNICSIFNKPYIYFDKVKQLMTKIDTINITKEQTNFCKAIYVMVCLKMKLYKLSYEYLNHIGCIKGPNICYNNMSFFNVNDKNKILFIYDGGGLGDKFLFSRFIPKISKKYNDNKIIFLVNDRLVWFFKELFKNLLNIRIVSDKQLHCIGHFDYHCNLISFLKHLNITYKTLYNTPLYKEINININDECKKIIDTFNKRTYIFNWKGNPNNGHEKNNRRMELENAIPLFQLNTINWIVITKNITIQEKRLLNKYNVNYYGNIIDKEKAFYDTISILKNVEGVISTDTS
ncbi:hypothetical protein OAI84_00540, partial [bacterium]|nr:hypothetical protein [bacterium]